MGSPFIGSTAIAPSLDGAPRSRDSRHRACNRRSFRLREAPGKAQQQLVHKLEKEIEQLEARQTEMLAELEKQETYDKPGRAQELNRELVHVQQQLAELNPAWEQHATRLAALE